MQSICSIQSSKIQKKFIKKKPSAVFFYIIKCPAG